MNIINIPLDQIHVDEEFNCRGDFNKTDVTDLARDINAHLSDSPETFGLIQPVTVREYNEAQQAKYGFKYGLVAGFRRYWAFTVLKRPAIPAIVKAAMSDADAATMNLSENLHRKNLDLLQESRAVKKLIDHNFLTLEEAAKRLNVSIAWVQIRVNLLALPEEIQKEAQAGVISQTHIRKLYQLRGDKEAQFRAVQKIKDTKLRGERVNDVQVVKAKVNPDRPKVRNRPDIFEMMDYLMKTTEAGLHTRLLAWAAGEVSDREIDTDIKQYCEENDKRYFKRSVLSMVESTS